MLEIHRVWYYNYLISVDTEYFYGTWVIADLDSTVSMGVQSEDHLC